MPLAYTKKNLLIILAALLLILCSGCGQGGNIEGEAQAIAVEVASAQMGEISQYLNLSGKITPQKEVYIVPKIPGVVNKINVAVGDYVKENAVLFTLENSEYLAQLNQAKSGYELSKKAQNDAQKNYSRIQALYNEGAVSLAQLEQAKLAWEGADTSAAAAGLALAQSAYDNTIIRAPMDGQVAELTLVEGAIASQGMAALRLLDAEKVKLEISVSEAYIGKVEAKQNVAVFVPSAGSEAFMGEITSIAPAADTRTMSFPVVITLDNAEGALKPGMFGQVDILMDKAENTLIIPKEALLSVMGANRVFVAEGEIARAKEVEPGLEDENFVQILSGLKAGESVIIRGRDKLQDGTKIIVNQP